MLDMRYDLKKVSLKDSKNPNERYLDILPINDLANAIQTTKIITPLIHAEKIGKILNHNNIFLKDESKHPTRTTKDRVATIGATHLRENGIKEFAVYSTGNTATSYALAATQVGMKLHIFLSENTKELFLPPKNWNGSLNIVPSPVQNVKPAAEKFSAETGIFLEQCPNPARREGMKLAYIEAIEQLRRVPDWIFQAVSSGMGIVAAHKGIQEIKEIGGYKGEVKFVPCQQESCNPMVRAFRDNSRTIKPEHVIQNPNGIAKAISSGNPPGTYPYIYDIAKKSGGEIMDVNDDEILAAMELAKQEDLIISQTAGVALASAIKKIRSGEVSKNETVLINITGGLREGQVFG